MPRTIEPGALIGGYRIKEVLGEGGMGLVYRAYHQRLQRWAAVKMLLNYGRRGDAMARFEREAQAVASLRHPGILTVFDFGEHEGQPYMVTEYMANGSLDARMPPATAAREAVRSLLVPLADALDHAHEQGLVHRDVKPANVFLDARFRPVLADFGLAKLHSAESITMTGVVSGTPSHMAPEQARGLELSGATDQYAPAVMAYCFVTGSLPFRGESAMEMLYAQVNAQPAPPSSLNPGLTAAADAVMARALAKAPGDRWPTCGAFAAALTAALEASPAGNGAALAAPLPPPLAEPPAGGAPGRCWPEPPSSCCRRAAARSTPSRVGPPPQPARTPGPPRRPPPPHRPAGPPARSRSSRPRRSRSGPP